MKKILATLAALLIVLGVTVIPAAAIDPVPPTVINGMTTTATIGGTGSAPPLVMAKWEQLDRNIFGNSEDGDLTHGTIGTQINPPCVYQANKAIEYYAVATDPTAGIGNVKQVWVQVNHPLNSWERGSEKYQFDLIKVAMTDLEAAAFVQKAIDEGLVTLDSTITPQILVEEVAQGQAYLYHYTANIYYEQPAGDYTVTASARNFQEIADSLVNTFNYVPAACFNLDNLAVPFGQVPVGPTGKPVGGDAIFSPNDNKMTVRNLANTNIQLLVGMDDMGFGKYIDGRWKVGFDGRVTDLVPTANFDPYIEQRLISSQTPLVPVVLLPGVAPHSQDTKVDYSIHVLVANSGNYIGNMVMTSQVGPMT